jgi:NADPH:quinone reductase-like Zn-dependent oxidoreductase
VPRQQGPGRVQVIDYTKEDFTNGGRRYDLMLDLGGNRPLAQLRRALTLRGTLVLVGGEGGGRWLGGMDRVLCAVVLSLFGSQRLRPVSGAANAAHLRTLKELVEATKVTPVVDRTYALNEVPDAIRALAAGNARGKLVVAVRGADDSADAEVPGALPHREQGHAQEQAAIAV